MVKFQIREMRIFVLICVVFIISSYTYAFKNEYPEPVHPMITKEAEELWSPMPNEISSHLTKPITSDMDTKGYDSEDGEDIESNVNLNNVTLGTTSLPTKMQMFSPDGSPTCCGADNSDVWSCTAGYC